MLPPTSIAEAANLADPVFRLTMMRQCILAVQADGSLWYPLLNLVATFLDGLASGPSGGTKTAYLAYVEKHFPDLSAAIGAKVFYDKYRNAAVHEFGLKEGYAIGRNSGLSGKYTALQPFHETDSSVTVLNIDRLVSDFLAHLNQLLAEHHAGTAP